jgi:hypothetical protein
MLIEIQTPGFDSWLKLGLKMSVGALTHVSCMLIFRRNWSMAATRMMRVGRRGAGAPERASASATP